MRPRASSTTIAGLASALREVLPADGIVTDEAGLRCYGYDAFLIEAVPDIVVMPRSTEQVQAVVRLANRFGVPWTPRGSGTGYAGGALPVEGGLTVLLTGLRPDIEIDDEQLSAWVGPGALTGELQDAALARGLRYPPDPSSYAISSMGGNVATNAGGPHSLRYGITTNYVLEVEIVDAEGNIRRLGGRNTCIDGLDLRGLFIGSEGLFGIATRIRVRLIRQPECISTLIAEFEQFDDAITAIERIAGSGHMPEALDMSAGFFMPGAEHLDVVDKSILYIDVEGAREDVACRTAAIRAIVDECGGAGEVLEKSELMARRFLKTQERTQRMIALTGLSRFFLFDAVVPRSALRQIFARMSALCQRHRLPTLNMFHAGDGNLHPMPFFDPADEDSTERLLRFWEELLLEVAAVGGCLSGEHGIGIEKRDLMGAFFERPQLRVMEAIKEKFDPSGLANPGKLVGGAARDCVRKHETVLEDGEDFRIEPIDGVVTVRGSLTLQELRRRMGSTPFEFAYEPIGESPKTTIAEAVQGGHPGLRELATGPSRDLLLGGVLSRPGSEPLAFGSALAKDVSGLELRRLAWGAAGTLGDLAVVRLKIMPRQAVCVAGIAALQDLTLAEAGSLVRRLFRLRLSWSYLGLAGIGDRPQRIVFGLQGPRETVDRNLRDLSDAAGPAFRPESSVFNTECHAAMSAGGGISFVAADPWELKEPMVGRDPWLGLAGIHCTASWAPAAVPHAPSNTRWIADVKDAFLGC